MFLRNDEGKEVETKVMLKSLTLTVSVCVLLIKKTFGLSSIFWVILDLLEGI